MIASTTLLTGALTWKIKAALIAALVLAALIAVRWWGNRQWAKGEQQGRDAGMEFIEKKKQVEWAEKERSIKNAEDAIAVDRKDLEMLRALDSKNRMEAFALIRAERERDRTINITIPANELPDAVRRRSDELDRGPKPVY